MRIKKSDFLPKIDVIKSFTNAVKVSKSKPWDSIEDFATHRDFCGNNLYPRQLTLLKLIYLEKENMTQYDMDVIGEWSESFSNKLYTVGIQEDIWDRMDYLRDHEYDHFRQVQAVMGRRASKGHIGGILMSERISSLVAMDNPQEYFGIDDGHDIYSFVIATSATQAQKYLFADLLSQVRKNAWLREYVITAADHLIEVRTPADIRQTATLMANGTPPRKPIATLKANPVSSNSSSSRGGAVISAGFDEFAFTPGGESQRSGESMYNAIEPSLDQFGKESLIYIPSSPWNKIGKFFKLYENGSILLDEYLEREGKLANKKNRSELEQEILLESEEILANPEMLIVQLESWGLYEDWEKAPVLLAKPNPRYSERKKNNLEITKTIDNHDKIRYVESPNALEVGDSLLIDGKVLTLANVEVEPDMPLFYKIFTEDDYSVVYPGPSFKNAIQVRPDPNGTTKARAMASMESSNPEMFRVERRAQFLSTQNPYLDMNKVSAIFSEFWDGRELYMQRSGKPKYDYYLHADPAKTGADFAVMIAHTETSPLPDIDGNYHDHMIVDFYKVYQPSDFKDGEINYLLIINELKDIIDNYPTLRSITMDQFNSVMPLQSLKKYANDRNRNISVSEQTFTNAWNQKMFSALKTAINLGWVHTPTDAFFKNGKGCLLEQELLFLEEIGGKVVKSNNPDVRHDDLVDCLGTLAVQLLGSQIQIMNDQLDSLSLSVANKKNEENYSLSSGYSNSEAINALNDLYSL